MIWPNNSPCPPSRTIWFRAPDESPTNAMTSNNLECIYVDSNQVTPSTFERDDEGVRKQLSSAPVQTQETVLALLKSFTSGEMQLILVRWNSTDIVSTRLSSGRRCFADPRVSEALAWECANMHLGLCGTKPVSIDIEQVPSWIEPSCRP